VFYFNQLLHNLSNHFLKKSFKKDLKEFKLIIFLSKKSFKKLVI